VRDADEKHPCPMAGCHCCVPQRCVNRGCVLRCYGMLEIAALPLTVSCAAREQRTPLLTMFSRHKKQTPLKFEVVNNLACGHCVCPMRSRGVCPSLLRTCLLNRLLIAQVCITVLSMSDLPAKYKHLRLITTRGAKAVSTKELFAVNQRCQVSRSLARALSLPFSCVCSLLLAADCTLRARTHRTHTRTDSPRARTGR
jgi:hypothetical protein